VQVFPLAKKLADCVIPAEYGISPDYKVRIGHKIAKELIGKLLLDLDNVKAESFSADQDLMQRAASQKRHSDGLFEGDGPSAAASRADGVAGGEADVVRGGDDDVPAGRTTEAARTLTSSAVMIGLGAPYPLQHPCLRSSLLQTYGEVLARVERQLRLQRTSNHTATTSAAQNAAGSSLQGEDDEAQRVHRLAPHHVHDINSPLRHVRTRIYFTSESHIHSLVNILRHEHLSGARLLSGAACTLLDEMTELDYCTQLVLRLYENKVVRPPSAWRRAALLSSAIL
jgi:Histidine phosphatase superfamily (branch 2)